MTKFYGSLCIISLAIGVIASAANPFNFILALVACLASFGMFMDASSQRVPVRRNVRRTR